MIIHPTSGTQTTEAASHSCIDVNVYFSRWPFRRLPSDEPDRLADSLAQSGVTEAWVGSFDALLHRDIASVNERTAEACRDRASMGWKAVGCVNPMLPDWVEDLRRCHEQYRMFAVRLHPNYHKYNLEDPSCQQLLKEAADRKLLVQIAASMEDARTQHPLCQVPRVNPVRIVEQLDSLPGLRVMWLNFFLGANAANAVAVLRRGRVWFDIATLEGIEGVGKLVQTLSPDSVVYGSLSPLFYASSAQLKLQESGLPESLLDRIRATNASNAITMKA